MRSDRAVACGCGAWAAVPRPRLDRAAARPASNSNKAGDRAAAGTGVVGKGTSSSGCVMRVSLLPLTRILCCITLIASQFMSLLCKTASVVLCRTSDKDLLSWRVAGTVR